MSDKASKWHGHQAAWRDSGMSVAAYCRRHGLSYSGWMYWQRRLGASALVPIRVEASAVASPSVASVEVVLPGGAVLRVGGLDVDGIVALARGLSC